MDKNKISAFIDKYFLYIFLALLAALAALCFINLGAGRVELWDEARHGVNAFEMLKEGNYIANYFGGNVDYWNLKPPISYYFIMLGYKIFGYNAWGLRFFSALSYYALAIVVSLFLKKQKGKLECLLSVLLFMSNWFFFYKHFVRRGDADALFILFAGVAIIALYLSSANSNWLCLAAFMFALCFLTKSWHAFFILPITFLYLIFTKGFKKIKWWQYFTTILSAVIPIFIWGIFRYRFDGWKFFAEMINYDLLKRSANALEGNKGFPFYYLAFLGANFTSLACAVVMFVGIGYKIKEKRLKGTKLNNLDILCLVSFACIYFLYQIAETKIYWYTFPACTPLTIIASVYIVEFLKNDNVKKKLKTAFAVSLAVLLFCGTGVATYFIFAPKQDGLQLFIKDMPYEQGTEVYFGDENSDMLNQSQLLCFEWRTNTIVKSGGYEEFVRSADANIILSKSYYEALDNDELKIIYESNGYVLCSFE